GFGITVDRQPDVGELSMDFVVDGVETGTVERDAQHAIGRPVEPEVRELVIAISHPPSPPPWPSRSRPCHSGCARLTAPPSAGAALCSPQPRPGSTPGAPRAST